MIKLSELFAKKWFVFFLLLSLVFFQLVYGFLFPSSGPSGGSWESITIFSPKFTGQSVDNFLLSKIYPLFSSRYTLHTDASYYLQLGQNFFAESYRGHMFLERPLWPFLIFLSSLPIRLFTAAPSYGIIFALAILLNFILLSASVMLFFSLLKALISLRVAWLSSILLIFSPYVHTFLNQPMAEMLMIFSVILSIYFLYDYVKKPSALKLVLFSLIIGILMLAKNYFAILFFILLLAIYFRRYKEGIIFLIFHFTPILLWYLWITQVWQISYYAFNVQRSHIGTWVFGIFLNWPWQEIYRLFLHFISDFITILIYSFLVVPVFFSIIGFQKLPIRSKNIVYFGSIFSVFALVFLIGRYNYRWIFLLFPIIYPTCILGIERVADLIKKYKPWLSFLFYAIIIGFIIFISQFNIYQFFDYFQGINIEARIYKLE